MNPYPAAESSPVKPPGVRPSEAAAVALASILFMFAARAAAFWILQDFPNSADEFAYRFQAELFARGDVWTPAHPCQEALSPFFIHTRADRVYSIFPPGWPLVLSAGAAAGVPFWVNPVLGGLGLAALYALLRLWHSRGTAALAALATGLSPFYLFNAASLFSHPACLLWVALAWIGLEKTRRGDSFRWAAMAGFAGGMAFITREYTSVLLLGPVAVHCLWRKRRAVAAAALIAAGALFPLLLYGWICREQSGIWFYPPRFLIPGEGLGFGAREIRLFDYVETIEFTLLDGLVNTMANLGRLFAWTFPGLPLAAAAGAFWTRRAGETRAAAAGFAALVLGYALYPGGGGNQYGPRFYFEAQPALALLAASAAAGARLRPTKRFIALSVCVLLAQNAFFGIAAHDRIDTRRTLEKLVERRNFENALVIVGAPSGDMTQGDLIRNLPGFETAPVVYAWDLGPRNPRLGDCFPDRELVFFGADPATGIPHLRRIAPDR